MRREERRRAWDAARRESAASTNRAPGRRALRAIRAVGAAGAVVLALLIAAAPGAAQVLDDEIYTFVLLDRFEYAPGMEARPVEWEALSWIGGDYDRLWLRTEGEYETAERAGHLEVQAHYGRLIAPFWDVLVGMRHDVAFSEDAADGRAFLSVGLEGLAPYLFELSPFVFVSQDGDISARLEASYHLLFTQRLVAEPELEVNVALQDVPEHGIGSGLNDVELGFRLRYEIVREIAPYVGYSWTRRFGQTADLVRAAGGEAGEGAFVAGLRVWY
ncbi:MAG: copper resistance protein B [Gemmatimonadota bacterium]